MVAYPEKVATTITASGGNDASERRLEEALTEHRKSVGVGGRRALSLSIDPIYFGKVPFLAEFDFVEFEPVLHSV